MSEAFVAADTSLKLQDWTVGDLLQYAASEAPEAIALKQNAGGPQEACTWTYTQLRADSRRLATFLLERFQPGEHVAIWASNSAQWTLYQLAAAQAGLVLVTLNPALREREVDALLRQSRSAGLIQDTEHRGTNLKSITEAIRPNLASLRVVLYTHEWRKHLAAAPGSEPNIHVKPSDPALLLYTSGTTGLPKGVVLRHRGIVNNAMLGSERYGVADRLAWLGVLPLFHVGGSVTSTLGCMARLGTNIVVQAFEPGATMKLIEEEKVVWFPVVPAMVIAMIEHETFREADLSSLQVVVTGGTTITPEFVRMVYERFRADVQVMFGQTEAGGAMCKTYRTDMVETIAATVGRPYPHTAMRIADVKTGTTLGCNEIGEIRIHSPFMTDGYFDNPKATASAFDHEGFLCTGDLGELDERGYLHITGRLKEMIIRGGENIYPREVEDILGEYPGIAEVAVVGVPSEKWGEEVAVAIRCGAGKLLEVEALREFMLARVARHKIPKLWKIVPEFPRTASGKIQKFEVVKWFLAGP